MAGRRRGELTVRVLADTAAARKGLRELGDESSRVGKITRFGFLAAATGVGAFVAAVASSIGPAAKLQSAITEVATLSEEAAARSTEFTAGVKRLSVETGQSQENLTQALYDTVSAGVDAAEAIGFVEQSSKLAIAGVTDVSIATDALTTATNAWASANLGAEEAADAIFSTVQLGKTTVEEFGSSLFQVAPLAATLGVSIQEVGAATATLTAQGVPTRQAMTQIRGAVQGLLRPTSELTSIFNAAGYASAQAAIEAEGFGFAARVVRDASGGSIGELQRLVGTIEGVQGILGITGDQAEVFGENLESIRGASGVAERAYSRMANTFEFQRRRLNQGIQLLRVEVGTLFLPVLTELVAKVADDVIPVLLNWREHLAPVIGQAEQARDGFNRLKDTVSDLGDAAGSAPISDLVSDVTAIVTAFTSGDVDFTTAAKAVRTAFMDALAEILGGDEGFDGVKAKLRSSLLSAAAGARSELADQDLPIWASDLVNNVDSAITAYLSGGVSLGTARAAIQAATHMALTAALDGVITELETTDAPRWVLGIATVLDEAVRGNISLPGPADLGLPNWATDLVGNVDSAITAYLSGGVSLETAGSAIQAATRMALADALAGVVTDLEAEGAAQWVMDIAAALDAAAAGNITLPQAGTEISGALTDAVNQAVEGITDNEEAQAGVNSFLADYGDLIVRATPFVLLPILGPIGLAAAATIGAGIVAYDASQTVRDFVDPIVGKITTAVDEHIPGVKEIATGIWTAITDGVVDFRAAIDDEFTPKTLDVSRDFARMGEDAEQFASRVNSAMVRDPGSVAVSSAEMAAQVGDDSILVGYWLGAYLTPVWESHQRNAHASYEETLLFSQSLVDLAKEIGLNKETFNFITDWATNWAQINAIGARDATVLLQDSMGDLGRHILSEFRQRIETATGVLRALKRSADEARSALQSLRLERAKEIPVVGGIVGGVAAIAESAARGAAILPSFQRGGIVPGPLGQPVPIIAHAGEEYLGVGEHRRGGDTYITNNYVSGSVIAERQLDSRFDQSSRRNRPNRVNFRHV